jgi:hypothetical protein
MPAAVPNSPALETENFVERLQFEASKAPSANTGREFVLAKLSTDTLAHVAAQKPFLEASDPREFHRLRQEYETKVSAVGKQFSVLTKLREDDGTLVADLVVDPPDSAVELSQEQSDLFNDIYTVKTVIIKACANLRSKAIVPTFFGLDSQGWSDGRRTADRYLRKLQEIADYGLVRGQINLAKRQLVSLKNEFVVSEADEIKNSHIRRLGIAAGLSSLVFAAIYGAILLGVSWSFLTSASADLLSLFVRAALGACIGTWLSFSIRKETLVFDELANLEADLLRPVYRLAFVILLTMTLCLLFTADAIQIEIGSLKTNVFAVKNVAAEIDAKARVSSWPGLVALLIGVLSGVSERGLASSVQKRSSEFTSSVGGVK